MVIARTYDIPPSAKIAIRLIRANDGKRDSGNRARRKDIEFGNGTRKEVAAGCGGPKDESPTVAVPGPPMDNREAKLSP